jgi:hypothetical protein
VSLHRKKKLFHIPVPSRDVKLSLGRNNDVIHKLFPPRESLVSDIPAGDGNIEKLFYGVGFIFGEMTPFLDFLFFFPVSDRKS